MINMSDIRKRQSYLNTKNEDVNIYVLSESAKRGKPFSMDSFLKNWKLLNTNEQFAFVESMKIFDEYCSNCNSKSDINKVIHILSEEVIPTIKDLNSAKRVVQNHDKENRLASVIESIGTNKICDRILNNQEKLNKLNFENIVRESNTRTDENIETCIEELCSVIDSLKIKFNVKYNLALENVLYTFDKLSVKYPREKILEKVTDYFLFSEGQSVEDMNYIIENTKLYSIEEKSKVAFIKGEVTKKTNEVKQIINDFKIKEKVKSPEVYRNLVKAIYTKSPEQIIEEVPNFFACIRVTLAASTVAINPILGIVVLFTDQFIALHTKRKYADAMVQKYQRELELVENKINKTKDEKKVENLKEYKKKLQDSVYKLEDYRDSLYTEKELDSRWETQNESSNSLYDEILKFEKEKPVSMEDYFKYYNTQVSSQVRKSIDGLSSVLLAKYKYLLNSNILSIIDNTEINKLTNLNPNSLVTYLDTDNKLCMPIAHFMCLNYIKEYAKKTNKDIIDILSDICDYVQDLLDTDYCCMFVGNDELYTIVLSFNIPIMVESDIKEHTMHNEVIKTISKVLAVEEQMNKLSQEDIDKIMQTIDDTIDMYSMPYIDSLTQLFINTTDVFDLDFMSKVYQEHRVNLINSDKPNKYSRSSCLYENKILLDKNKYAVNDRINPFTKLFSVNEAIQSIKEYSDIVDRTESIEEISASNHAKLALDRMKKSTRHLSDKEKMMSSRIDYSVEKFNDEVQNAIVSRNRESVIKGSLMPKASNIIKLAIATPVAFMINPAIAVVGIIAGIAVKKYLTEKERQFILDEIDIQLKLVEKKISLAESNNDMKSMEELLKLEKRLRRERQRIHYHMRNYYPVNAKD